MKSDLMDLKLYKITGNLSDVIAKILSLIGPVIKRYTLIQYNWNSAKPREHKWGEQRDSRYTL